MGESCPPYTSLGAQTVPCLLWGQLPSRSQAPLAGGHDLCVLTFLAWVLSFLGLFIQGFWPKSLQLPLPRLHFGVDEPWRQFPPFWLITQFFSTSNLIPLFCSDPRVQYSRAHKTTRAICPWCPQQWNVLTPMLIHQPPQQCLSLGENRLPFLQF